MEPKHELPPANYTPAEQAELEKTRTISDAELLKGGAEYVVNEKGEKENLLIKADQEDEIKLEQEDIKMLEERGWHDIHEFLSTYPHYYLVIDNKKVVDKAREMLKARGILRESNLDSGKFMVCHPTCMADGINHYIKSEKLKLRSGGKSRGETVILEDEFQGPESVDSELRDYELGGLKYYVKKEEFVTKISHEREETFLPVELEGTLLKRIERNEDTDYVVKDLLDKNYLREAKMPSYIPYTLAKGELPHGSTTKEEFVHYDKPEVIKSGHFISKESGKPCEIVVIKSQIDFRVGEGRQYVFQAYSIDADGRTELLKETGGFYERKLKEMEDAGVKPLNTEEVLSSVATKEISLTDFLDA